MKDKSLIYKLNIIKNKGNILNNLQQYLCIDNGNGYESILQIIKRTEQGKALVFSGFCLSYDDLWNGFKPIIKHLSLEKSLIWNILLLKENITIINDFLILRVKIEQFVLNGDFKASREILGELEKKCGVSFWSLEVRLILDKYIGESSISEINNKSLHILMDLLKIKLDNREQGIRYKKKIIDIISGVSDYYFKHYLKYKLEVVNENNLDFAKSILMFESVNSIIDIFIAVQFILLNFRKLLSNNELKKKVIELSNLCVDKSLIVVFDESANFEIEKKDYEKLITFFEKKDFQKVIEVFESKKDVYILNPFLIYLYDVALMINGAQLTDIEENEAISEHIIKRLFLYFSNNRNKDKKNSQEIETLCRVFSVFYFSKELNFIFSKFNTPMKMNHEAIMLNEKTTQIIKLFSSSSNILLNFYFIEREKYDINKMEKLLNECKKIQSIEFYKYICMIEAYINYYYFLSSNRYEDALNVLINEFVVLSESVGGFDIEQISRWIESVKYASDITIQKLIYIYIVNQFKDLKTAAFLNFLDYYNIKEPLQVLDLNNIENELKIYYLEKICSVGNLSQIYFLFENSDEVEDYRIRICKGIIDLLGADKKLLREEINVIYRNRKKRNKITELEQGKLSVDFTAIRLSIKKDFGELFYFYNKISKDELEISSESGLLKKSIQKIIDIIGQDFETIYISKRMSVVREMYELYLKEFCFGKNGLDIYLSTRIRHGTFSNQIFRIFQSHNIVKDRFSQTTYSNTLLTIYFKLEAVINEVTQKKLKVNYEESESTAIFNFYEDDIIFYKALNNIVSKFCINEESCLGAIEEIVTNKANNFLAKIREELLPKVKEDLSNILNELLVKTKEIIGEDDYYISLEKDVNDCNVELKETIEKISAWFILPKGTAWPSFSFNELIELCREIGKNLHYNFEEAIVNINLDQEYCLKGNYYNDLNDIFMILINNAFIHSGYNGKRVNQLRINIDITSIDDNRLKISFSNNLYLGNINREKIDRDISAVNEYFNSAEFSDYHLHQEGGTGLYRTINILFFILNIGYSFHVERKNNIFNVEIVIKKSEVLDEKSIIN